MLDTHKSNSTKQESSYYSYTKFADTSVKLDSTDAADVCLL